MPPSVGDQPHGGAADVLNAGRKRIAWLMRFHHVINSDKVFGTHTAIVGRFAPWYRLLAAQFGRHIYTAIAALIHAVDTRTLKCHFRM
jgi:hypothetical protein